MDKKTYRFGVALLAALIVALVCYASRLQPAATTGAEQLQVETFQAAAWSSVPRWRSFVAFHALFLGLIATAFGTISLYRITRPGPAALTVGMLAALVYFTFEPRATIAELPLVGQLLFLFGTGLVSASLLRRAASPPSPISWGIYLLPSSVVILMAQLGRRFAILPAVSATVGQELLLSAIFALGGVLVGTASWGAAREIFAAPHPVPTGSRTTKQVFQALLLVFFICAFISFLIIDRSDPTTRQWALIAPVVPVFMAFYAPYQWLFADAPSAVFVPGDAPPDVQQMRFFTGVLFEYLSVGTFVAALLALRRPQSTLRLLIALFGIVLYWAPGLWLLSTMKGASARF